MEAFILMRDSATNRDDIARMENPIQKLLDCEKAVSFTLTSIWFDATIRDPWSIRKQDSSSGLSQSTSWPALPTDVAFKNTSLISFWSTSTPTTERWAFCYNTLQSTSVDRLHTCGDKGLVLLLDHDAVAHHDWWTFDPIPLRMSDAEKERFGSGRPLVEPVVVWIPLAHVVDLFTEHFN